MAQRVFEQMLIYSMAAEVRCMQCQSGIISDVLFVNLCLYAQSDPVCFNSVCPPMLYVVVS